MVACNLAGSSGWVKGRCDMRGVASAPFSPQAGRHAVPAQVRAMRELAGVHGITSFRIGADLEADPELWLRAVEYLYPVRLAPEARMVFTRKSP